MDAASHANFLVCSIITLRPFTRLLVIRHACMILCDYHG